MKRTDLVKHLNKIGCILLRHGERHDIYHNPVTGNSEPVPRHREINEVLARRIIKKLKNDDEQGKFT